MRPAFSASNCGSGVWGKVENVKERSKEITTV